MPFISPFSFWDSIIYPLFFMVSHNPYRLSSLFHFFPPLFPSIWTISYELSSNSQFLSSAWSSLLWMFYCTFCLFILFFSLRISVWFFVMISISLLNFLFCSWIVFWFHWIVFPCCLVLHWSSLQQLFWILYGANYRLPFLWGCSLENYCIPLVGLCFLIFSCLLKSCIAFF